MTDGAFGLIFRCRYVKCNFTVRTPNAQYDPEPMGVGGDGERGDLLSDKRAYVPPRPDTSMEVSEELVILDDAAPVARSTASSKLDTGEDVATCDSTVRTCVLLVILLLVILLLFCVLT